MSKDSISRQVARQAMRKLETAQKIRTRIDKRGDRRLALLKKKAESKMKALEGK